MLEGRNQACVHLSVHPQTQHVHCVLHMVVVPQSHILMRYARRKESGFYASECPPTDTACSPRLAGSGWSSWSVMVVPQSRVSDMRYARRKESGLCTSECPPTDSMFAAPRWVRLEQLERGTYAVVMSPHSSPCTDWIPSSHACERLTVFSLTGSTFTLNEHFKAPYREKALQRQACSRTYSERL